MRNRILRNRSTLIVRAPSTARASATSTLRVRFLVGASDAARSLGREEAATSVLATTISFLLRAHGPTHAVQDAREDKACHSSPHEGKRLGAELGDLAVVTELVTALDEHSGHQAGGDDLEEQCHPGHERREIASNAGAHGQEAGEEGHHGEEESDDQEGEDEPRSQEVVLRSDERGRDIGRGVKVPVAGRVKWEVGIRFSTLALPIGIDAA